MPPHIAGEMTDKKKKKKKKKKKDTQLVRVKVNYDSI